MDDDHPHLTLESISPKINQQGVALLMECVGFHETTLRKIALPN